MKIYSTFAITTLLFTQMSFAATTPACKEADKIQYYKDADGDKYVANATVVKLCPSANKTGYVLKTEAKVDAAKKPLVDCKDTPLPTPPAKGVVDSLEKIVINGALRNTLVKYNVRDINCDGKYVYTSTLAGSTYCGSADPAIQDAALMCGSEPKFKYVTPAAERNKIPKEANPANDIKNVNSVSAIVVTHNGQFSNPIKILSADGATWLFQKECSVLPKPTDVCDVTGEWYGLNNLKTLKLHEKVWAPTGECSGQKVFSADAKACVAPKANICSWGETFNTTRNRCEYAKSTSSLPRCSLLTNYSYQPDVQVVAPENRSLKMKIRCDRTTDSSNFLLAKIQFDNRTTSATKSSSWFLIDSQAFSAGIKEVNLDVPEYLLPLELGSMTVYLRTAYIKDGDISKIKNDAEFNAPSSAYFPLNLPVISTGSSSSSGGTTGGNSSSSSSTSSTSSTSSSSSSESGSNPDGTCKAGWHEEEEMSADLEFNEYEDDLECTQECSDPGNNPVEECNGIDDNSNGVIDEGCEEEEPVTMNYYFDKFITNVCSLIGPSMAYAGGPDIPDGSGIFGNCSFLFNNKATRFVGSVWRHTAGIVVDPVTDVVSGVAADVTNPLDLAKSSCQAPGDIVKGIRKEFTGQYRNLKKSKKCVKD